jgi:hypothetical protein
MPVSKTFPPVRSSRLRGYRLTRRDAVAVEPGFFRDLFASPFRLVEGLLGLFRGPEPPTPLLVHLGARGDAVDREEEQLLGFDDGKQVRDVVEDGEEDVVFRDAERGVIVVRVRTVVDDAVHVQVEGIEFGDAVLLDELRNERVALPVRHTSC